MNILVTGSTGFMGYWMQKTCPPGIWAIGLPHKDYDDMDWEKYSWDAIVHLAPIAPTRILKCAKKCKAKVIFVSSGAVYDRQDEYSANKHLWEEECVNSGVYLAIVRPFCFIGEHLMLKNFAIGQFILEGVRGGPVHYYDIGCLRSYMYGRDLGDWLWRIAIFGEGVYDIGSSIALTMKEVALTVAEVCGCAAIENLPVEDGKPLVYLPDTRRAKELGCKETVGLREAIKRTIHGID